MLSTSGENAANSVGSRRAISREEAIVNCKREIKAERKLESL